MRHVTLVLWLVAGAAAVAEQPLAELPRVGPREIPMLAPPEPGRRVEVRSGEELAAAVEGARDGDVIVLADGTYRAGRALKFDRVKNVTLRGASADPAKVILRGRGFASEGRGDDILQIGGCENVTVAYVTLADCRSYGLKVEAEHSPKNIHVYGCNFLNIGTRGLKGSTAARTIAAGGSVRHCHFENSLIPPAEWLYGGNYISAIDMMSLEDWTISDNTFVNVKGQSGGGRAAIFVWVRSRRVVIERNRIAGCDRGIALGNPSGSSTEVPGMLHAYDCVCRNNAIVCGADAGIELAWVDGIKVQHNSVWRQNLQGRGIRCIEKIANTEIANNLVRGALALSGPEMSKGNLAGPLDGLFVDPPAGNLRLRAIASEAIDKGVPIPGLTDDLDRRKRDAHPDLGAYEFNPDG